MPRCIWRPWSTECECSGRLEARAHLLPSKNLCKSNCPHSAPIGQRLTAQAHPCCPPTSIMASSASASFTMWYVAQYALEKQMMEDVGLTFLSLDVLKTVIPRFSVFGQDSLARQGQGPACSGSAGEASGAAGQESEGQLLRVPSASGVQGVQQVSQLPLSLHT